MQHKHWSLQKLATAALTALTFVVSLAPALAQGRPEILWMRGSYNNLYQYYSWWPITFSPNGAFIIGAENLTGMLKVFRVADGALVRTLPHGMQSVKRVAFSPNGDRFALGNDDQVRIYRYPEGTLLHTLNTNSLGLAFTADGSLVATVSGSTIRFWNVSNGTQAFSINASASVNDLALSPDGSLCAAACADSRVRVWRLSDRSLRYSRTVPTQPWDVAFSPGGDRLAAAYDRYIRLYRASDGSQLRDIDARNQIEEYAPFISNIVFVQNGDQIAIGHSPYDWSYPSEESYLRLVHFYDVNTGAHLRTLDNGRGTTIALAASPNGSFLLVAGSRITSGSVCDYDGPRSVAIHSDALGLWRVADLRHIRDMSYWSVASVALSRNSAYAAYSQGLFSAADGHRISLLGIDATGGFSNDGSLIATGGVYYTCQYEDMGGGSGYYQQVPVGTFSVRRVADGSEVLSYSADGEVYSVDFSPDASHVAVSGYRTERYWNPEYGYWETIRRDFIDIWRLSDRTRVRTIESFALRVAYSPDGTTLATASGQVVIFRRVSDGAEIGRTAAHSDTITSIAYSPDGSLLATGCRDGTVRLWRTSNRTLVRTHQQPVPSDSSRRVVVVAFSRDGEILASGGSDLRFWRVSNGALERVYDDEVGAGIRSLSFADGLFAYSRWDDVVVVARYTGRRIRLPVPVSIR